MKIKKVDSKSVILHEGSKVTLKTCGDSREVLFTAGNNTKCPIQNLSKDKYLDKETGEIKERVHQENRTSLRKVLERVSRGWVMSSAVTLRRRVIVNGLR